MHGVKVLSWNVRSGHAMGSTLEVVVYGASPELLDWAYSEADRLERCWSRFDSDSELCALNATAGEGWFQASPTLFMALDVARVMHCATGGLFDPTVLDALEGCGYDRSFRRISSRTPEPTNPACGFARVELDPNGKRVRLPEGCRLDLGGVGKGLAADHVATGLVNRGAVAACVSFGGDMRCAGIPFDGGWRIPVARPAEPDTVCFEHVINGDGAVVTSTSALRRWDMSGNEMHHLIDPRTGRPANSGLVGAVVAAPSAAVAEVVAKSLVVGGRSAVPLVYSLGLEAWLSRGGHSLAHIDGRKAPCLAS